VTTIRPIHYAGPAAERLAEFASPPATETIPAISLAQPWASWVALGWKTIETRCHNGFAGLVGRRLAICASKTWDREALDVADVFMSAEQVYAHGRMTAAGLYPKGEIVAVARMLRLQPCTHVELARSALCWYEGGVGYVLGDVSPLPVGLRVAGSLGIFYIDLPAIWVRQLPLPLLVDKNAELPA